MKDLVKRMKSFILFDFPLDTANITAQFSETQQKSQLETPGWSTTVHLELFLEEFTREQNTQTKSLMDMAKTINSLSDRFVHFQEELNKHKLISVSSDMQPIQDLVEKSIADIKLVVSTQQQKPIIRKFQLLLFPEQDSKLFYKLIFGRWFLWLTIMLLLTNLYKFGIHWNDNQSEIELRLLEHDRIEKSWNYLYLNGSKGIKKLMDTVYKHVNAK